MSSYSKPLSLILDDDDDWQGLTATLSLTLTSTSSSSSQPSVASTDELLNEEEGKDFTFHKLSILSPTRGDPDQGMFFSNPTLSFDSSDSNASHEGSQNWWDRVDPVELLVYADRLNKKITKIKEVWSKPFIDIESGFHLLAEDMRIMDANTHVLGSHLGKPMSIDGASPDTI
jgi:hypothetical protein